MNTLNFYLTADFPAGDPNDNACGPSENAECRGWDADQPDEFDRQRDKLIAAIAGLDADVVGLNELENTLGVDPLGDPADGLVAGLDDLFGAGTYDSIDTGTIGTDAIKVGVIYRPAAVTPVGDYAVLDSTVDPRFDTAFNRPALAQTFEENATGARFTVVVNHLKSKGSDCNAVGDPDIGDGQGNCNLTRLAAAEALVDWIQTDPTGSGDRDYLIMGDLNSYAMEDPIDAIRRGPDDTAGTGDDYTNLIAQFGGAYAYSYVFDGQAGYLDHALSSATLTSQITGVTEWHINADEPDILDYDTSFKPPAQDALYEPNAYRSSDHDPVLVGLDLLAYGFDGYLPPVHDEVNVAKAGSTVPIRFTLASATGLEVLFANPVSAESSCATGEVTGPWQPTGAVVGLTADDPPHYTYDWKTSKSWSGTCRTFELTLDDGTYRTAFFHFVK
jgi:predicted extracellular nuclease